MLKVSRAVLSFRVGDIMGQSGKVTPGIAPMRTQQFGCKTQGQRLN